MRYRNKITGLEIVTDCVISGANFEEVSQKDEAPKASVKESKPKTTTTKRAKKSLPPEQKNLQ